MSYLHSNLTQETHDEIMSLILDGPKKVKCVESPREKADAVYEAISVLEQLDLHMKNVVESLGDPEPVSVFL